MCTSNIHIRTELDLEFSFANDITSNIIIFNRCQSIAFAGGRLFACSQGENTVVELDYVQGTIMRRFHGLPATGSTQLNVNNRFIVSNGAYNVKFWSTESTVRF